MSDQNMVHWSSLSQSLQTKINDLEEQSNNNKEKIQTNGKIIDGLKDLLDKMDSKIEEIEDKITNDFNKTHNRVNEVTVESNMRDDIRFFIEQSEIGSLARIDGDKIIGYELLDIVLVYDKDIDRDLMLEIKDQLMDKMYEYDKTDTSLYDIKNNKRYMINDNGELVDTGDIGDWLRNYMFLANPITHKVFFYFFKENYVNLSNRCDILTGKIYKF